MAYRRLMTAQLFPAQSRHCVSLAQHSPICGTELGDEDRAEIGHVLADLLFELHQSGALRPTVVEATDGRGLDLHLSVPGAGSVLAHLRFANGCYELSVTGDFWDGMLVLREAEGRLSQLYAYYFSSHADEQRRAKDRLVRGLQQLMLVNDWGVRHYQYA